MLHKENLHHAHLFEGHKDDIIVKLQTFFVDELTISIHGNPDYWYEEFDSIGIDDARSISFMQQRRPAAGDKKIFVIVFNSITREAQNALLKVFEEPTDGTHFFLITPSVASLLPTLKSRLNIHGQASNSNRTYVKATAFLKETPAGRLKIIKKIIDSDTAKADALLFISNIEEAVQHQIEENPQIGTKVTELYTVKSYLNDTSASVKMLLEHLSLTLPKL